MLKLRHSLKGLGKVRKAVWLTIMVYYSESLQIKISKGKGTGMKPNRNQRDTLNSHNSDV